MSTPENDSGDSRKILTDLAQVIFGKLAFDAEDARLTAKIVERINGLPPAEARALVKSITDAIIDAPAP